MSSFGTYISDFVSISTFEGTRNSWAFGWFIGSGPLWALFVTRISNGRMTREILLVVAVIAPVITNF
ncbi:BCCT family transporter [Sporosarcina aquimarina]|uniref:BCCT family transporter n=1 Tax=Sporosarcina aquimarina TaxID=114975 RepID=A0ABU4G0K9_9BACL|nr:BCCT family transporter [Sporosarcina aquimarina]MDW0110493.1 BCCT family transporter [Sporosarcina aquimarina]